MKPPSELLRHGSQKLLLIPYVILKAHDGYPMTTATNPKITAGMEVQK